MKTKYRITFEFTMPESWTRDSMIECEMMESERPDYVDGSYSENNFTEEQKLMIEKYPVDAIEIIGVAFLGKKINLNSFDDLFVEPIGENLEIKCFVEILK